MSGITGISRRLRQRQAVIAMDGIRDAIEQWRSDQIPVLTSRHQKIFGSKKHAALLAEVVAGRLDNQMSHAEASSALVEASTSLPSVGATPVTWFVWENLARAIGCFRASLHFTDGAFQHITALPTRSDEEKARVFLAHLYQGDLERAGQTWHTASPTPDSGNLWTDAGHLLWLLSAGQAGASDHLLGDAFADDVSGRDILVWGPAPTDTPPSLPDDGYVARVIAPGVTGFDPDDAVGGRCDIAYASSRVTKGLIAEDAADLLEPFQWVCFRTDSWRRLSVPQGRTAKNHKRLLPSPWDKTNVIPLAVWDLLHVRDVSVRVGGTTFFASAQAYTPQETRLKDEASGKTDERGSTGLRFERCLSLAHHNLSAHHTLMALMQKAGCVQFDAAGEAVLRLSLEDYMDEIDSLYGVDAV